MRRRAQTAITYSSAGCMWAHKSIDSNCTLNSTVPAAHTANELREHRTPAAATTTTNEHTTHTYTQHVPHTHTYTHTRTKHIRQAHCPISAGSQQLASSPRPAAGRRVWQTPDRRQAA